MKTYFVAVLVSIFALQISAGRYALLIGHNDGGETVRPLAYAEQDVKRLANILIESGGFDASNVKLLIHPDSISISDAFTKLKESIANKDSGQNNLAVVYYSGHADIGGLLLGKHHFSFESLYKTFGSLNAAVQIGIFDACYSGAVTAFKGGVRAEPLFFENLQNVKGQVIIASSAANERAQESSSLKSSVFSFHLCNGLRGSADLSGDKKITLNEVYQYAYRKTVETSALTSGEIQHPVYKFNIQGQGDIILTSFDQKSGGLLFDKHSTGKYLVLSENFLDVFADFYKEKGNEHFISLNAGRYTVIRAHKKDVSTLSLTLKESKNQKIRDNMFTSDVLSESRVKGPPQVDEPIQADKKHVPLSTVSFAAGSGLSLAFGSGSEVLRKDAAVNISVIWFLNQLTDFNIELTGYPSLKDVSIQSGIDFIKNRDRKTVFFTGVGAGILYDYQSRSTDNVLPQFTLHCGISFAPGPRTLFGIRVPFTIGIDRDVLFRTGLEFRLQLFGKYRDVMVLR